jgi:nitroimidazol reductase NimA-like FMN-containing flavoprotein (pyridoxamine 5'-phosphate oxidase superfamily)
MRAAKKEIKDPAVITDLFTQSHVGRLGTIGADGSPMIKPLNFVYLDGDIYFHSAREGEKMDDMKRDARVCFEIDLPLGYVRNDKSPCRAGYRYRSVIVKGRALTVEDRETKLRVLAALMEKYQPEGGYGPIPEDKLALTAVVRIIIHRVSGKEDPG